eukprot:gnl/Carplike_NY0171/8581_a11901_161.p1 GENE.gnl/Carplike_NY0171/8581_a11901_161~~gnl/Carplike_NY0171/8581_a11901_161.p1  ORF type:complete len:366 (+),score=57.50 gnl/Carplike_NY0171/8581_a11901_161:42-1100(+)
MMANSPCFPTSSDEFVLNVFEHPAILALKRDELEYGIQNIDRIISLTYRFMSPNDECSNNDGEYEGSWCDCKRWKPNLTNNLYTLRTGRMCDGATIQRTDGTVGIVPLIDYEGSSWSAYSVLMPRYSQKLYIPFASTTNDSNSLVCIAVQTQSGSVMFHGVANSFDEDTDYMQSTDFYADLYLSSFSSSIHPYILPHSIVVPLCGKATNGNAIWFVFSGSDPELSSITISTLESSHLSRSSLPRAFKSFFMDTDDTIILFIGVSLFSISVGFIIICRFGNKQVEWEREQATPAFIYKIDNPKIKKKKKKELEKKRKQMEKNGRERRKMRSPASLPRMFDRTVPLPALNDQLS